DVERARLAAERARAQLAAKAGEEVDIAQAQAALRRALIRLKVAERLSRTHHPRF
ncbi:MAG: hypothetical protein HYZ73_04930, partial [Elusimicrobia bacterium]|nr:hypothetical protein [Elusimicrobiota bacterium]